MRHQPKGKFEHKLPFFCGNDEQIADKCLPAVYKNMQVLSIPNNLLNKYFN